MSVAEEIKAKIKKKQKHISKKYKSLINKWHFQKDVPTAVNAKSVFCYYGVILLFVHVIRYFTLAQNHHNPQDPRLTNGQCHKNLLQTKTRKMQLNQCVFLQALRMQHTLGKTLLQCAKSLKERLHCPCLNCFPLSLCFSCCHWAGFFTKVSIYGTKASAICRTKTGRATVLSSCYPQITVEQMEYPAKEKEPL